MNGRKQRRRGCLFSLLLAVVVVVFLPCLLVWREMREERLSAQLLATVQRVLTRSEMNFSDDEKAREAKAKQQTLQDETTVARLLREGADPNVRNFVVGKRTLWEEVELLLKRMLNPPSASGSLPRSALAMAVEAQDASIVTALLKAGANDVNGQVMHQGWNAPSPLVNYAAFVGNLEIVQALCEHGADIHKPGLASSGVGVPILQAALDCNPGYTDRMTFDTDETMGLQRQTRTAIFHLLLTRGAKYEPNSKEGYALLYTATQGDFLDVIRELLTAGVPPNARVDWLDKFSVEYSPLDTAVAEDDLALVTLLFQHGALPRDKHAEAPIILARSAEMAKLLLEHGADIHAGSRSRKRAGENALVFASMRGDTKLISFLLAHGFDVNSGGAHGNPILEAAGYADIKTVRLLLQHGAKVGPNSPGANALFVAIAVSRSDIAELLLQNGAAVNAKGDDAPLAEAANQDNIEIARELLDRGADVNAGKGAALLAACKSCDEDLVELLLKHGANPNARSDDGTTAIQVAKQNADPPGDANGIIALLKQYGKQYGAKR